MKSDANQNTSRVLMTFNVENWSIVSIFLFFLRTMSFSPALFLLLQTTTSISPTEKSHF